MAITHEIFQFVGFSVIVLTVSYIGTCIVEVILETISKNIEDFIDYKKFKRDNSNDDFMVIRIMKEKEVEKIYE